MPTIKQAEFPIKEAPLKGPAIDKWDARKEENNNDPFSSEKLQKNYESVKETLFAELRGIMAQTPQA